MWDKSHLIREVVLACASMDDATQRWRIAAWAFGGAVLLFALMSPTLQVVQRVIGGAQSANSVLRHTVQVAAADTVIAVRDRPLRMVSIALAAGIAVGSLVGFGVGWLARSRRGGRGRPISESREGPADRSG